jgi:uroporphyrinogen-III decarboxylase
MNAVETSTIRDYCLALANSGLRMPIGTDLVLHEHPDADAIVLDGRRLGRLLEESARRWSTPLAVPLMDLRLEKADLLAILGVPEDAVDLFHFHEPPRDDQITLVESAADMPFPRRNQAHFDSIRYIARETSLVPLGMAIGPFSLMTKLLADPITPIAMAGTGITATEDTSVAQVERCLKLAELAVRRSVLEQIRAGARAILICEPAANVVYLSPKQMDRGSDIFERFVMEPDLRLKRLLESESCDLIFHDCGELTTFMVREFAVRLHPVILSLGASRKLWIDAAVVPRDVVLFGNLPTKTFYSDSVMPVAQVESLTIDLVARMRDTGHPFILGSECDVLHVPDAADTIRQKVVAMLACGRD